MYDIAEKRRFKRIEKPYMTRFRIKPAGNGDKVAEVDYKINKLNFSDIAATLSLAS